MLGLLTWRRLELITRDDFLNRMPSEEVRQAVKRLMDVAEETGGIVKFYRAGISIRCQIRGQQAVSIAWLYPPGARGWMKTRDFPIGIGLDGFEDVTEEHGEVLVAWSRSALSGLNSIDVSNDWAIARSITHEEAADNIDVLAERLESVLRELAARPA